MKLVSLTFFLTDETQALRGQAADQGNKWCIQTQEDVISKSVFLNDHIMLPPVIQSKG